MFAKIQIQRLNWIGLEQYIHLKVSLGIVFKTRQNGCVAFSFTGGFPYLQFVPSNLK